VSKRFAYSFTELSPPSLIQINFKTVNLGFTNSLQGFYSFLATPAPRGAMLRLMKTTKVIQMITLGFALTMLTSFVLYSQLTQTRTVAPGSKSAVLTVGKKDASNGNQPATNSVTAGPSETIIWGSKSQAPLLKMPPELFETRLGIDAKGLPVVTQPSKPERKLAATNITASTVNNP
jgi:hypothetical protein